MVKLTGGGIQSNKTVQNTKGQKVEPKAHAASVEGVAQVGLSHQFKPKPMLEGKGYEPKALGSTGIANARKGDAGPGPGGGNRTIFPSGSQSPTPPAHGMPPGRDTLSEFGSDVPGRRR